MLVDPTYKIVRNTEIECPVPAAGKEIYIEGQLPLRWSFRDGPSGAGPEPMNTNISIKSKGRCAWVPGSRWCRAPQMTSLWVYSRLSGYLLI
jgi:hypothetical protein